MGRPACVDDVHELARSMPHVRVVHGPKGNPDYQVGGKSFGEVDRDELTEIVQDAWLAQASARRGAAWLADRGPDDTARR